MILIFVRTIIIYVLVLCVMRLMGKREIGQMQPFELVISIMIADLASTPMTEIGIPILYWIIPIFGMLFMHIAISVINIKSIRMREIICGKPRILIDKGRIDERALIKENFTINELQERLRVNDVNNISDVEYSVILKAEKSPATCEDLNIQVDKTKISYDLVLDGRIMNDNLKKIEKDQAWLEKEISKFNMVPTEALIFVLNGDGTFYCQRKIRGKAWDF